MHTILFKHYSLVSQWHNLGRQTDRQIHSCTNFCNFKEAASVVHLVYKLCDLIIQLSMYSSYCKYTSISISTVNIIYIPQSQG